MTALGIPLPAGASPGAAATATVVAPCFHCGTRADAPVLRRVDGQERPFCCEGCAAAAQWIETARLGDYYRLRSATGSRVDARPGDFAGWDDADLQREQVRVLADGGHEITVVTDGMRCAACAWLIDRALAAEPGVADVSANAVTGRIRIEWRPAQTQLSRLLARLAALGYRPSLAGSARDERTARAARRGAVLRLGIAGLASLQAMMFAEALYLDTTASMPLPTRDFLRFVTLLVATPTVLYAGWPFLAGAARELRQRAPGMDTLVAAAALLALGASVVETLRGGPQVWYDAAVMFVFVLLVARQVEARTRQVAAARIDTLARAQPPLALRERDDGRTESVAVARLRAGDVLRVPAGEVVPADAALLDAQAAFAENLLTGESHPVPKQAGDEVYAGTLCADRSTRLRVLRTGAATRLAELARLVDRAQQHRPRAARLADRVASRFVVALLLASTLVFAAWRIVDPSRAFEVTLALLVVSCPCALSLAVPAVLAAAHGRLSGLGILVGKPDALETLAQVTDIVFDKTGTLTDGHLVLASVATTPAAANADADVAGGAGSSASVTGIAAALAAGSRHPVARAFADLPCPAIATDIAEFAGQGLEGTVAGHRYRLGQPSFAVGAPPKGIARAADNHTQVCLASGRDGAWTVIARFGLAERLRPDAAAAVAALRDAGLTVHLCSGDSANAVARIARALGIEQAASRRTPADKLAYLRALQREGRVVAMVGDGLNDAPVLAGADVSVAMPDAAALAQRAADLVLLRPALGCVGAAVQIARRARRVMRQNVAWAIGYNLVALPLAATGQVTPWIAALAMVTSSLTVTANALRLARGTSA